MNEQLILEVIENHHQPFSVGQGEKERFKQKIFMHSGGPFPVEAKMNINNPVDALPIGKYVIQPSAYKVGKYGDVEVNQWELRNNLVPYKSALRKAVA